jgi:hypothetical protein
MERVAVIESLFNRLKFMMEIIRRNEVHQRQTLSLLNTPADNHTTETQGYVKIP